MMLEAKFNDFEIWKLSGRFFLWYSQRRQGAYLTSKEPPQISFDIPLA